jgi:8-oxo-dGTP pyrophosphatase MutT (NUDIX family)
MSKELPMPIVSLLARALQRIRSTPPRIIASPSNQPRRAAVALIIRIVPSPNTPLPTKTTVTSLNEFFELDWVNDFNARPEILFLHRENATLDTASLLNPKARESKDAQVAFPGGKAEPDDEGGLFTAMRQTWEETGIDLAEKDYVLVGQLDDREITTSLGKRLLMILSPFVFIQVTPHVPPPDPISTTTLLWTPLSSLVSPDSPPRWSSVTVDAASRLVSKHSPILRLLIQILIGTMQFRAIILEPRNTAAANGKATSTHDVLEKGISQELPPQQLKLWGLSLGMTLDLMAYMIYPPPPPNQRVYTPNSESPPLSPLAHVMHLPYQEIAEDLRVDLVAPSLASVFPRFSYPDVNFWIWVFGKRYRAVIRGWEASLRAGGVNDRRINWSGSALSTFYAAVRKALIVVFVGRALGVLFGLAFAGWWIFGQ